MGLSFHWWPIAYAARDTSSGGYWLVHIVVPLIGLQTPLTPWYFLYLLHWGPCVPSNSWLWSSTSVFAMHRNSLIRDRYIRILSAKSCWCMQWYHHLESDYGMDHQVWQSLDGPSFHICSKLCFCNSLHEYFVLHFKAGWSIHNLVFHFLEFHVFCKLYLGYSKFLG